MNMNWPAQIAGARRALPMVFWRRRRYGLSPDSLPLWPFGAAEAVRHLCGCDFSGVSGIRRRIYIFRGGVSLLTALPYLAGGLIGGFLGGKLYGKVSTKFLKWLFAAFLFTRG